MIFPKYSEVIVATPVLRDLFYHDGRGPSLQAAHLAPGGLHLLAIDYLLPNAAHLVDDLRHLEFVGPQVYMVTPEEVENYSKPHPWGPDGVAIVSLGRSEWLNGFNPRLLEKCEHFRVMFHDELLDVICVAIKSHVGGYLTRKRA
jgi:hypothetical protein